MQAVEGVARIGDLAGRVGGGAFFLDVAACQRGAAEQDRDADVLAGHLLEIFTHDDRRFDQQAGHADRLGVVLAHGGQHVGERHLDAEIDDPVAIVGQDDVDQVLPMSCTSPFTVASTIVPRVWPATRSMCGSR